MAGSSQEYFLAIGHHKAANLLGGFPNYVTVTVMKQHDRIGGGFHSFDMIRIHHEGRTVNSVKSDHPGKPPFTLHRTQQREKGSLAPFLL